MVVIGFGRIVPVERFADRSSVRREVRPGDGEVRHAGAVVGGSVVILNALGDRGAELLSVISGRDPLSFRGIADKSAFQQDRRDFDVSQNVEARVAHSAVKDGKSRQNGGVNGSSQRNVLTINRVAGATAVGARDVVFARGV